MFEPKSPRLIVVRSRISAKSWSARVGEAQKAEKLILHVEKIVEQGESLNEALRMTVTPDKRSWLLRCWIKYHQGGFEALIDSRTPREPHLSRECGSIIQAARAANPNLSFDAVIEILKEHKVEKLPSASTIKIHFRRADDRRRHAAGKRGSPDQVVTLELAGGELLLAAEIETGLMDALTNEVMRLADAAKAASQGRQPTKDTKHRDERGHFTAKYNHMRRRGRDQATATYLLPAADKAVGRVPSWPRFVREKRNTIEAKIKTLIMSWMVSETKGWEALKAPQVESLEPLTGFAYMPSTLSKMTSALAISGAGQPMLEAVGSHWHTVAEERWGEPGAIAALYIDNHAKEVWSSLFTLSGKVSHLSRVMPCITTTYVHTGAGTPLVATIQSGSAPLAPRLHTLIENAEQKLGGDVRRAVVIDAEGSTFDILESFVMSCEDESTSRVIVTPLRPSRAPELELKHSPGSYYRPYREHDQLRIGTATLLHRGSGRSIEIGVLEVRREHRECDTLLLTNGLTLGMEGRALADLYYARWPVQENFFKNAKCIGLAEHRGNCSRMVANVAVESMLEQLERRKNAAHQKLIKLDESQAAIDETAKKVRSEFAKTTRVLATRRKHLDGLIAKGLREGKQLGQATIEHQEALKQVEDSTAAYNKVNAEVEKRTLTRTKAEDDLVKITKQREKLEPRRKIRQIDVELDRILTATKISAALLISFVLREYLGSVPFSPETFISRILKIRGRREVRPDEERIIFYENPRDLEVTEVIRDACSRLNKRALSRNKRRLYYDIEPPPKVKETRL